jgi:hypothetical protein
MAEQSGAYRAEIEQVLETFLRRVLAAQGGQGLKVTRAVRNALMMLAQADPPGRREPGPDPKRLDRLSRIEGFLSRPALPSKPDEFAKAAAQYLPNPVDRAALYNLLRLPVSESPSSTLESRLAGGAQPSQLDVLDPKRPSPAQERTQKSEAAGRRWAGEKKEPTEWGPFFPQEVVQVRKELLAPPRTPPAPRPQAQSYPAVEQAIDGLAPDSRAIARQLAQALDLAYQRGQHQADLTLPPSAGKARDPLQQVGDLDAMARLIRDSLPHRATGVRFVDVYAGNRRIRRVALDAKLK